MIEEIDDHNEITEVDEKAEEKTGLVPENKDTKDGQTSTMDKSVVHENDHENTEEQTRLVQGYEENQKLSQRLRSYRQKVTSRSDDKRLEGIRSLWYGSLWSTSDYIASIYKYKPWSDVYLFYVVMHVLFYFYLLWLILLHSLHFLD